MEGFKALVSFVGRVGYTAFDVGRGFDCRTILGQKQFWMASEGAIVCCCILECSAFVSVGSTAYNKLVFPAGEAHLDLLSFACTVMFCIRKSGVFGFVLLGKLYKHDVQLSRDTIGVSNRHNAAHHLGPSPTTSRKWRISQ